MTGSKNEELADAQYLRSDLYVESLSRLCKFSLSTCFCLPGLAGNSPAESSLA